MYYENLTVRYINTMRYSGVCFAAAEAYARDGQNGMATATVNRLLGAYGAELMDKSLEGDALIEAILAEKQKEFVGEGKRYWDLVRTGMAKEVLAAGTHEWRTQGWHEGKKYWPLPQAELDKDPNLTPNVGY